MKNSIIDKCLKENRTFIFVYLRVKNILFFVLYRLRDKF